MTLLPGPVEGATAVTVWSLELRDPAQLRPGRPPSVDPLLLKAERPAPELSRFFYETVGGPWSWVDRLSWTPQQWLAWVDRPEHELWSCWVDGVPAGYVELERQADGDVEIAYFGLLASMTGVGLGGWLLTRAAERAWRLDGTRRVWVHTCSLDGPAALANYEARGFVRYREDVEWRAVENPPA